MAFKIVNISTRQNWFGDNLSRYTKSLKLSKLLPEGDDVPFEGMYRGGMYKFIVMTNWQRPGALGGRWPKMKSIDIDGALGRFNCSFRLIYDWEWIRMYGIKGTKNSMMELADVLSIEPLTLNVVDDTLDEQELYNKTKAGLFIETIKTKNIPGTRSREIGIEFASMDYVKFIERVELYCNTENFQILPVHSFYKGVQ